jgi:hypothetical protein
LRPAFPGRRVERLGGSSEAAVAAKAGSVIDRIERSLDDLPPDLRILELAEIAAHGEPERLARRHAEPASRSATAA